MNNEIKEILDKLKDIDKTSILKNNDAKILLDYITNLQQKVKHYEETQTFGDYVKEVNLLIDYKSRIEKADEYIERYSFISDISGCGNSSRYVPLEVKLERYENGNILIKTENLLDIVNGKE